MKRVNFVTYGQQGDHILFHTAVSICYMFTGKYLFDVQRLVEVVYDIEEGKIDVYEIEDDMDEIIDVTDEGKDKMSQDM